MLLLDTEVCTLQEAFHIVGCPMELGGFANSMVVKPTNKTRKLHINPDGSCWHFCGGPVLWSFGKVTRNHSGFSYKRVAGGFAVVMRQDDGINKRLEIAQTD